MAVSYLYTQWGREFLSNKSNSHIELRTEWIQAATNGHPLKFEMKLMSNYDCNANFEMWFYKKNCSMFLKLDLFEFRIQTILLSCRTNSVNHGLCKQSNSSMKCSGQNQKREHVWFSLWSCLYHCEKCRGILASNKHLSNDDHGEMFWGEGVQSGWRLENAIVRGYMLSARTTAV